jgi:uncharacterized protein YgiM (DUF1202 family)
MTPRPRIVWKGESYPVLQETENYYLVESTEGKRFSIHESEASPFTGFEPKNKRKPKKKD